MHLRGEKGPLPALWKNSPEEFNRRMYEKGTTENGCFGVKIMWENLEDMRRFYISIPEWSNFNAPEVLENIFPNAKYIYISRRDKVRQAVSMVKAIKTGYFTSRQEDEAKEKGEYKTAKEYDHETVFQQYKRLLKEDELWQNYFKQINVSPYRVIYEEFVDNYEKTIRNVLEFIDVEGWNAIEIGEKALRKQADEENEKWAEAFYNFLSSTEIS